MKKIIALSLAVMTLCFTAACGNAANAVENEVKEEITDAAEDIQEDIDEVNLAEVIKNEAVSAGQDNLYNITGVVTDASMNTVTIETEQGSVITLSTDDDTKTEYKDGLLIGINVMVTVECDIDNVESDMDVDVVSIKEL